MLRALLILALTTAPALARDPTKTERNGGADLDKIDVGSEVLLRGNPTSSNGCASNAGAFATDGTQSWQPSCFGVFSAPGSTIPVYPTRGTAKDGNGNPISRHTTPLLVQFQSVGNTRNEINGQFINGDVVGGPISAAELDTTNTTGQLISLRQRPGPKGERPATTWGHNIDLHIAPGSGNVQSYGVEYDMNNFNKDCAPGSGCLSAGIFLNGISGHPNTAWIYSGGGATNTYKGTVTVADNTVTWVSGQKFVPAVYNITINEKNYRAHYVSPTRLAGDIAIPNTSSPIAYTAQNAMAHYGVFFQGANNISDADFGSFTNAYSGIKIAGNHQVAFDASGDTGLYALLARSGQALCLNGFTGCLRYDTGVSGLRYGASFVVTDAGSVNIGGVLNSPLSTPASSSSSCATGDWAHDANFVYTCVARNTWRRAALSSW